MTRTRRLSISLALNLVLVVVQVSVAGISHSVGLLADAGHNLTDVFALALSLVAVRLALRPASAERSFGNHRATILVALANAAVLAVVTIAIVVDSVHRLNHPEPIRAGMVVAVAAVSILVNAAAVLLLHDGTGDLNMRSAMLHMAGDCLSSLAVLVSATVLVFVPSAQWLDPAAALVVAAIIMVGAAGVVRSSVSVLLESTPSDIDLDELTAVMSGTEGVAEVHDLHVWSLSSEVRALSAHVVVTGHPTLEEAQVVGDRVKRAVGTPFAIAHSTLELECERCVDDQGDPCAMDTPEVVTHGAEHHAH